MKPLIYLACPYSDPDPQVSLHRFHQVNKCAAHLFAQGLFVFSPISHTHPIKVDSGLAGDWKFWSAYDELMINKCQLLLVLCLPGWQESVGVTAEISIAERLGREVGYLDPISFAVVERPL